MSKMRILLIVICSIVVIALLVWFRLQPAKAPSELVDKYEKSEIINDTSSVSGSSDNIGVQYNDNSNIEQSVVTEEPETFAVDQ